jgi:hypothetical protein
MYHILIKGASYKGLEFDQRERIREALRERLEQKGIRFVEYPWVWDENDQCLLLAGSYERLEDARWWIEALRSAGFEICTRTTLPGDPAGPAEIASELHRPKRLM